jgi:hypothetical protein
VQAWRRAKTTWKYYCPVDIILTSALYITNDVAVSTETQVHISVCRMFCSSGLSTRFDCLNPVGVNLCFPSYGPLSGPQILVQRDRFWRHRHVHCHIWFRADSCHIHSSFISQPAENGNAVERHTIIPDLRRESRPTLVVIKLWFADMLGLQGAKYCLRAGGGLSEMGEFVVCTTIISWPLKKQQRCRKCSFYLFNENITACHLADLGVCGKMMEIIFKTFGERMWPDRTQCRVMNMVIKRRFS